MYKEIPDFNLRALAKKWGQTHVGNWRTDLEYKVNPNIKMPDPERMKEEREKFLARYK